MTRSNCPSHCNSPSQPVKHIHRNPSYWMDVKSRTMRTRRLPFGLWFWKTNSIQTRYNSRNHSLEYWAYLDQESIQPCPKICTASRKGKQESTRSIKRVCRYLWKESSGTISQVTTIWPCNRTQGRLSPKRLQGLLTLRQGTIGTEHIP